MKCSLPTVLAHNATASERNVTPINSILCPGLGTAIGRMPYGKAAIQVSMEFPFTLLGGQCIMLHRFEELIIH